MHHPLSPLLVKGEPGLAGNLGFTQTDKLSSTDITKTDQYTPRCLSEVATHCYNLKE